MTEFNAPDISSLADFFKFIDTNVTSGFFTAAVIVVTIAVTYLYVLSATKNEKGSLLAALFMGFFTSALWGLAIGNPVAVVAMVASVIGIVIVGKFF